MRRSFKYRLYPTKGQVARLQASLDACRWVYNETLATKQRAYDEDGVSVSKYELHKLLPVWKQDRPELQQAYAQSLQDAQARVDLAFKAFFRRVNQGKKPGYPRFKSRHRYDSFTFPQKPATPIDGRVRIPKVGMVKIKDHRQLQGTPKIATVFRSATGKWYMSYSCEDVPASSVKRKDAVAVGVDVGCVTFATMSDGSTIASPKFLRNDLSKVASAGRRHSSRKQAKTKRHLAMAHERIANKRRDFLHKESRKLVNKYSSICLEDLNIEGMLKSNTFKSLNRSISDSSWATFINFVQYKAEEAGTVVTLVNPKDTTDTCSGCGAVQPKALSDRIHDCAYCGLSLDRDLNASLNILALGQQSLARA